MYLYYTHLGLRCNTLHSFEFRGSNKLCTFTSGGIGMKQRLHIFILSVTFLKTHVLNNVKSTF